MAFLQVRPSQHLPDSSQPAPDCLQVGAVHLALMQRAGLQQSTFSSQPTPTALQVGAAGGCSNKQERSRRVSVACRLGAAAAPAGAPGALVHWRRPRECGVLLTGEDAGSARLQSTDDREPPMDCVEYWYALMPPAGVSRGRPGQRALAGGWGRARRQASRAADRLASTRFGSPAPLLLA